MRNLIITLLLAISFAFSQDEFQALAGPFMVAKVIDAQTLELSNGDENTQVELLGIVTARGGAEPLCALYHSMALDFTQDLLAKEVWLEFDIAEHEDSQTLYAYVYLADEMGNWTYEPRHFIQINEQLLLQGLAEPFFAETAMRYEDKYILASIKARENGLGIWSDAETKQACFNN